MPRALNLMFSMPRGSIGPESMSKPRQSAPPVPPGVNPMPIFTTLPPPPPASVTISRGVDAPTVTPPRTPRQVGAPDVPQIAQIDINKIWQQRKLENPLDSEASR